MNGATIGGNRTVAGLKAEQEISIAQETAKQAKEESDAIKTEVNILHERRDAHQSDVETLQ